MMIIQLLYHFDKETVPDRCMNYMRRHCVHCFSWSVLSNRSVFFMAFLNCFTSLSINAAAFTASAEKKTKEYGGIDESMRT